MGFAISWLAVKGKPQEVLAAELGLAPTGETGECGDSLFTGGELPTGWFLLVIDKCDHRFVKPEVLRSLSSSCEVIACSIEEHVMFCRSELWRDGARVWVIEHDAQISIEHIVASGNLPSDYGAIEREYKEAQRAAGGSEADVDYFFEIPLQAASNIVGFKHDEVDSATEDERFMVFELEAAQSRKAIGGQGNKPWWKLW